MLCGTRIGFKGLGLQKPEGLQILLLRVLYCEYSIQYNDTPQSHYGPRYFMNSKTLCNQANPDHSILSANYLDRLRSRD